MAKKSKSNVHEFGLEYGKPVEFVPADHAIEALKDSGLPPLLFEYWKEYGFSKYLDGYFQMVNPLDYEAAIADWLKGSPFEGADRFFAIRMDAFGNMQVWGARLGSVFNIKVDYHAIYKTGYNDEAMIRSGKGGQMVEGLLYDVLAEKVVPTSKNGRIRLFHKAKEKLGVLGPNQIYSLSPAAPLGGQMELKHLKIAHAPDYLAMLPEIAPVREMTMQDLARMAFGDGAAELLDKQLKE